MSPLGVPGLADAIARARRRRLRILCMILIYLFLTCDGAENAVTESVDY